APTPAEFARQPEARAGQQRRNGVRYRVEGDGEAEETAMELGRECSALFGSRRRRRLLRQSPGRFLRIITVRLRDECPNRIKRAVKGECTQMSSNRFRKSCRYPKQAVVLKQPFRRGRHDPITIALDHAKHSVRQISQLPGKLGFVSLPQALSQE